MFTSINNSKYINQVTSDRIEFFTPKDLSIALDASIRTLRHREGMIKMLTVLESWTNGSTDWISMAQKRRSIWGWIRNWRTRRVEPAPLQVTSWYQLSVVKWVFAAGLVREGKVLGDLAAAQGRRCHRIGMATTG